MIGQINGKKEMNDGFGSLEDVMKKAEELNIIGKEERRLMSDFGVDGLMKKYKERLTSVLSSKSNIDDLINPAQRFYLSLIERISPKISEKYKDMIKMGIAKNEFNRLVKKLSIADNKFRSLTYRIRKQLLGKTTQLYHEEKRFHELHNLAYKTQETYDSLIEEKQKLDSDLKNLLKAEDMDSIDVKVVQDRMLELDRKIDSAQQLLSSVSIEQDVVLSKIKTINYNVAVTKQLDLFFSSYKTATERARRKLESYSKIAMKSPTKVDVQYLKAINEALEKSKGVIDGFADLTGMQNKMLKNLPSVVSNGKENGIDGSIIIDIKKEIDRSMEEAKERIEQSSRDYFNYRLMR